MTELFEQVAALEGWEFGPSKFRQWTDFGGHEGWRRLSVEDFCFRLIKKYKLCVLYSDLVYEQTGWRCGLYTDDGTPGLFAIRYFPGVHKSLERAICLAVLEIAS